MKTTILAFSIILFSLFGKHSQQNAVELNSNFNMQITGVTYKKSVTATLQLVVAKKNHKIITLETILNSKSKKRELLDLKQLKFVANGEEYALVTQKGLGVWNNTTGLRLKFKGEKKTKLYIQVKDNIKEGILYFNDNEIYEIKVSSKSKSGMAKVL